MYLPQVANSDLFKILLIYKYKYQLYTVWFSKINMIKQIAALTK